MSKIIIHWVPDRESSVPVYKQIIDYISMKISAGDWTIGSRLPSQRQLAKQFQVNRSTIVTAMEELSSYGILESDFGKGTYVASNTWSLMMSETPPDWGSYIQTGCFRASDPVLQECIRYTSDPNCIQLGIGQLSQRFFPKEMMKAALQRVAHSIDKLNYTEPLGLLSLRKAISRRLFHCGIDAPASCILITSGSMQALQLISLSMLRPGAAIYTGEPTYLKGLQFFHSAGMKLTGLPMDQEGLVYWQMDPSRIQKENSLLYAVADFHNPTGIVMSLERRKSLFRFCRQNRLPIIEDAAYSELWLDNPPPPPLKSMDKNGLVLYVGTASKTLAPGLRTGWIVGAEAVIHRLADMKMQMDLGTSSLSQMALAEFLSSGMYDEHLSRLRHQLKQRRDLVLEILNRNFRDLAVWTAPAGSFYIWLKFDERLASRQLFHMALREHILLFPGCIFEHPKSSNLRISYAYADERELGYALARLAKLIRAML